MEPRQQSDGAPAPEPSRRRASRGWRILGVPLRFHFTFTVLVVFLIINGAQGGQAAWLFSAYVLALFTSVLLHELGHVAVARRFRVRTTEITIYPVGGIARFERTPPPRQEFWIALAGPAVNLAVAAVLFALVYLSGSPAGWTSMADPEPGNLPERVAWGNLLLAGFNLLPAFPMDGGRVLRALLARRKSEEEATRIAALFGRMLAIALGLFGLLQGNVFLMFIAFIVYIGASQESAVAVGRALSHGVPVRAAMITDYRTLAHGDSLRDAANMLLATSQQDFPVVLGEQVVGLLSRTALLLGMAREGLDAYVAGNMDRNFVTIAPDMDLADAIPLLGPTGSCALVMDGERLLGLLTRENFAEFLMLRRLGMEADRDSGTLL